VGEATVWIPKVDPEMENAEKKKPSTHNQFYSVVKGKGHHGEKGEEG
jgi:hypothetical protein